MKIEDLKRKEIEQRLARAKAEVEKNRKKLADSEAEMTRLNAEIRQARTSLDIEEMRREMLAQALILCDGVPTEVAKIREHILTQLERERSRDITVGAKEALGLQIVELIKSLRLACDHRFVVGCYGYRGDYLHEFENINRGYRFCILCTIREEERTPGSKEYEMLAEKDGRIVMTRGREEIAAFITDWQQSTDNLLEKFAAPILFKLAAAKPPKKG